MPPEMYKTALRPQKNCIRINIMAAKNTGRDQNSDFFEGV
jgi:hypothetical protein